METRASPKSTILAPILHFRGGHGTNLSHGLFPQSRSKDLLQVLDVRRVGFRFRVAGIATVPKRQDRRHRRGLHGAHPHGRRYGHQRQSQQRVQAGFITLHSQARGAHSLFGLQLHLGDRRGVGRVVHVLADRWRRVEQRSGGCHGSDPGSGHAKQHRPKCKIVHACGQKQRSLRRRRVRVGVGAGGGGCWRGGNAGKEMEPETEWKQQETGEFC